jgi:hypothetical protein
VTRAWVIFGVLVSLLTASEAAAQDTDAAGGGKVAAGGEAAKPADDGLPDPGAEDTSYSHFFQFGIRASLVIPYRMVFRYDSSPWCNKEQVLDNVPTNDRQKFCGFGGPLAVDAALSFAPLGPIEPYLFGRFGLAGEGNTNTQPVKIIGVGARIYTMSDSAFKVFIEPGIGYEFEDGAGHELWRRPDGTEFEYRKDMVLHLGVGPQMDVSRGVGFFLNGGMTVGILRMIHASLELQLGAQARFP